MTRPSAALVHDYFIQDGGAERCAVEFADLLSRAPIYTTFFDHERFGDRIDPRRVHTWPLQRIGQLHRRFRMLLPLYPLYFGGLEIDADVVISSSVAFTKAIRTRRDALHVSYIYTPMRYAWDLDTYVEGSSLSASERLAARLVRPLLQRWDVRTAARPDVLVAISQTVQDRIERLWQRQSRVIYPPVDVESFDPTRPDGGFFLVASRLLAYRRIDIAVQACSRLGVPLVVVGDGPERERLAAMAGPSIRLLGHVARERLVELMETCHAYLLPGLEDFGIAPVEAMSAGKPVVAFRGGGATETVVEGVSGIFFDRKDPMAMADAIREADGWSWDREAIRSNAARFSAERFRREWRRLLDEVVQ